MRIDVFSLKGKGFVSEFGKKPSAPLDVKLSGVKSTIQKGQMAYGSELIAGKFGKSLVSKYVPRYSELFKKSDIGGVGGGGVKILSPGSVKDIVSGKGVVKLDIVGGKVRLNIPKSIAKNIGSGSQVAKVITKQTTKDAFSASMLSGVSRQAAAQAYVVSQTGKISPSWNLPLLVSEPKMRGQDYGVDFGSVGSLGKLDLGQLQESQVKILGVVSPSPSRYMQRQKQFLILETLQKQTVPDVALKQDQRLNVVQRQRPNVMQRQRSNVVQKQAQQQINKQMLQAQKQQANILKNIPGVSSAQPFPFYPNLTPGIPAGFPGFLGGFGGGGRGKSEFLIGTKHTLKNPWPDADEFADKILGTGKKKRRRKKK